MANPALTKFIKKHCANWFGIECVFNGKCNVTEGKPCGWFEKDVWAIGDPNYPYATHTEGCLKRLSEYLTINKGFKRPQYDTGRFCECGQALQSKKRICDSCAKKRVGENRVFSVKART